MQWSLNSDIGSFRDQNEDYALTQQLGEGMLAVVCDGMGGCLAGEVASEEAAEMMRSTCIELLKQTDDIGEALFRALQRANARVWHLSASEDEYMGMGTTLTAVWTEGNTAWFVSVGDSRAYVLTGKKLVQVTEDQSFVWDLYIQGAITKDQMRSHPMNHLVNMAVGLKPELGKQDICMLSREVSPGDLILLCSDGLTDEISEEEIASCIISEGSLDEKTEALVNAANQASGRDNITVLLMEI